MLLAGGGICVGSPDFVLICPPEHPHGCVAVRAMPWVCCIAGALLTHMCVVFAACIILILANTVRPSTEGHSCFAVSHRLPILACAVIRECRCPSRVGHHLLGCALGSHLLLRVWPATVAHHLLHCGGALVCGFYVRTRCSPLCCAVAIRCCACSSLRWRPFPRHSRPRPLSRGIRHCTECTVQKARACARSTGGRRIMPCFLLRGRELCRST